MYFVLQRYIQRDLQTSPRTKTKEEEENYIILNIFNVISMIEFFWLSFFLHCRLRQNTYIQNQWFLRYMNVNLILISNFSIAFGKVAYSILFRLTGSKKIKFFCSDKYQVSEYCEVWMWWVTLPSSVFSKYQKRSIRKRSNMKITFFTWLYYRNSQLI